MNGGGVLDFVTEKAQLDPDVRWGLFEVVCDGIVGKTYISCCVWADRID